MKDGLASDFFAKGAALGNRRHCRRPNPVRPPLAIIRTMHDETIANSRLLVLLRLLMKFGRSMKWQKLSHRRCPGTCPGLCRICDRRHHNIWLVRYLGHSWGQSGLSHKIFLYLPTLCSSNHRFTLSFFTKLIGHQQPTLHQSWEGVLN